MNGLERVIIEELGDRGWLSYPLLYHYVRKRISACSQFELNRTVRLLIVSGYVEVVENEDDAVYPSYNLTSLV